MPKPIKGKRVQPQPKVKEHTLHPALGAPLWWAADFARKRWKLAAWAASLIVVGYLPYLSHTHSHYLDDRRCDRISYAAQVAYQYGCEGQNCSPQHAAYEQQVRMTYGALMAGCYVPAPIRPDQALTMFFDMAVDALESANDQESPSYEAAPIDEVEFVEVSG